MTRDKHTPGYFRVDADGIVRDWDEKMATMLGYEPSEAVGMNMELLIPESYRERHWKGFRAAMSRGSTVHDQPALNVPLIHKEGSVSQYSAREIFLRDAFGASLGVLVIINEKADVNVDNELPSPYSDALGC